MKRKSFAMLFSTVLLLMMTIMLSSGSAFAANTTWTGINEDDWVVAPEATSNMTGMAWISFASLEYATGQEPVITDVKSSKKKVATAEASSGTIWLEYGMTRGTTKISFKINGVPYEHDFSVKYICPFKTFKIGKKSYMSTFKKKQFFITKQSVKKQKLTVKCKKGWVITKICTIKNYNEKYKDCNLTSYSVKKFSAPKMMDGIVFTVKNTTTGFEEEVSFTKAYDSRRAVAG